jgi:carotenoid 1,2-hydratase
VFSPYYAWSGRGAPDNHCAVNVALYGARHHRWAMTERPRARLRRAADVFAVADSSLSWRGDRLIIDIAETAAPIPLPLRGRIEVRPEAAASRAIALDAAGRHLWTPIAPRCDVQVDFSQPGLAWRGAGYLDSNQGAEPLEAGFRRWDWARAHAPDGCVVTYSATARTGPALDMALHIDRAGAITRRELPPLQRLPAGVWRVARQTRADAARIATVFEDAPFYARTALDATLYGHRGPALHESLDLDRFARGWVRALLPVRMPRRG